MPLRCKKNTEVATLNRYCAVLDDRPIAEKLVPIKDSGKHGYWIYSAIYLPSIGAEEQLPYNVEIKGELIKNVSGGRIPAPMWKEFMEEVVKDLPVENWPSDSSDIDKYYEIPTIEIPQLLGQYIRCRRDSFFKLYFTFN